MEYNKPDKFLFALLKVVIFTFILYIILFFAVFSCNRKPRVQRVDFNTLNDAKIITIDSCQYISIDKYTGLAHKGNCINH